MKESNVKIVCEDCGKEAPIDHKKSTENWIAYKDKCECGGKTVPKMI
ncbi:hypothetical protein [Halanaerobium salsuginis]|uniref:SR1 protein n=1 Tax=Halanaerobium salsuginis TaxID=29563 RepID=A0A1I4EXM8_9FIRM|nr:hypothetical protein [Halanaerobium salsuginis]SFL09840.1 hypothetical protein SAMN02983006_00177 [Halanaerobium salsuginis]